MMTRTKKLHVAVLGATGVAGQQFLSALATHPWLEVTKLGASERSAGRSYREAITDGSGALRWYAGGTPDKTHLDLLVEDARTLDPGSVDLAFSAVEGDAARELEPRFAAHVPVISTANAFRYEDDVPIFLPGVNLDHAALIAHQKRKRGWRGFITPGPNCTTTGLVIALKPILTHFGLSRVVMTSLQSCSGAGRSPGVLGLDIIDNIVPYIPKEEYKVEVETRKILGSLKEGEEPRIEPLQLPISCTCTRVPVLEGHTEAVFCGTTRKAPIAEVAEVLSSFGSEFVQLGLPSAPKKLIEVQMDPFRPQPRLDRDCGNGLTTVVGRLREEQALGDHGVKFVLVSHNTKMGAAGGAILIAEYLIHQGLM